MLPAALTKQRFATLKPMTHNSFFSGAGFVKAKIHYTISFHVASPLQDGAGKSPLCLLCRVSSQTPLRRLVAKLLRTSYGLTDLLAMSLYHIVLS